jgi:gas vesicle protein
MAYEYDRFEREDGGGSFLMGLLAGTVLGAGLGMLFAPRAGAELRSQLSEQTGRLRTSANDAYSQASEKVHQMVDRGREAYDRARAGAHEAADTVAETLGSATGVGSGSATRTGSAGGVGSGPSSRTGSASGVGTSPGHGSDHRG